MSESSKPFYCALCNKGYSKQPHLATHESSYEHHHAQRRRDLQSQTAAKAKVARAAADDNGAGDMRRLDTAASKPAGESRGFKKGTFKSAFTKAAPADDDAAAKQATATSAEAQPAPEPAAAVKTQDAPQPAAATAATKAAETEAPRQQVTYQIDGVTVPRYDPFNPTPCHDYDDDDDDDEDLCEHKVPWAGRYSDFARAWPEPGDDDAGGDDEEDGEDEAVAGLEGARVPRGYPVRSSR